MAEHPTVNRTVAGSSPAAGAHRSEPQSYRLGLRRSPVWVIGMNMSQQTAFRSLRVSAYANFEARRTFTVSGESAPMITVSD